jgi:ribosomal protein L20A (L18A)
MKAFRISWHAVIEDGSVLDGRSLIYADSEEKAVENLIIQKAKEYRIKHEWIRIETVAEIPNLETDETR